ncbi:hypothetical protein [Caballeronia sp. GAWG1-5s-s]|uniref:hypothetical protein n=1 Tax=Caballeronia sp. GAWG1-5s-s TaxID=2921743 RepID=UPI0020281798|nr:hypothetical protein [Caballeronia sp. GAWG1-5s-s]
MDEDGSYIAAGKETLERWRLALALAAGGWRLAAGGWRLARQHERNDHDRVGVSTRANRFSRRRALLEPR